MNFFFSFPFSLLAFATVLNSVNFYACAHPLVENRDEELKKNSSIVDFASQINDYEARLEYAKILSHNKEKEEEAFRQFSLLIKLQPQDPHLWLEISRLSIAHHKFTEAFTILDALVRKEPLAFNFSFEDLKQQVKNELKGDSYSLIEPTDQINDDQATLELARIYAKHKKKLIHAISLYQALLQKNPEDATLLLELSQVYSKQKLPEMALETLYFALKKHPEHRKLLVAAAREELNLGHPCASQILYRKALEISEEQTLLFEYANVLMMVGSFYKAEAIYKEALIKNPCSLKLSLQLGWALVSAQRYEEAEGLYRNLLLTFPCHPKVLKALVGLNMMQKNYNRALQVSEELYTAFPHHADYLQLVADSLFKQENYDEALHTYDRLSHHPKFFIQGKIGMGRIFLKLGKCDEAKNSFQEAFDHDPSSIPAQFYLMIECAEEDVCVQTRINQAKGPKELIEWANIYSENGIGGMVEFFEAALQMDPHYFPAQIGLAEALNFHYKYEESLEIYSSILDTFPEASKILIEIARIHSWWKNYKKSMEWYDHIISLNPQDPLPRREKARVAYWGKFFKKSMETYDEYLSPTVDQLILSEFQTLNLSSSPFNSCFEWLLNYSEGGTIYTFYEMLSGHFNDFFNDLDACEKEKIELLLVNYLPLYLIQKSFWLERMAKNLDWQNYFLHALPVYQELAGFSPGNEEGLYGYAQDYCNLGLCNCARSLYGHLLNIDPNHNIVKMALTRNLLKERPLVQGNYTYWTERGSGQFSNSQIARHQFDQVYEWSPQCNRHFRLMQHEWVEYPFFTQRYYPAEGQTIEIDHTFNGTIKGVASATRKNYFNKFPSRYTCLGALYFNLCDHANFEVGFERKNEIYNYFTLKQGIQAKVYWASLRRISHSWNLAATYRHLDYNDRNTLEHANLLIACTLTEDPLTFKIIFDGSFRNAAHLTEIITNPAGRIVNIIHPYWTPRNYYSGSLTLEFRYNYAWFTYCEAPQSYIDFKLTGEGDTAKNPSIQLAINWKHEFMYHWGFEITGLYHRSRLWNAEGVWSQVYYRF